MRKSVFTAAAVLSLGTLAACSSGTGNTPSVETTVRQEGIYTAGTYTGKGKGNNGDIVVEVTVSETEITNIEIKEHTETEGICEPALEEIPKAVLDSQNEKVDVVSGATVTSNGIMEAVSDALSQARGEDNKEQTAAFVPGEYSASADGHNGELQVTIILDENGITQIRTEHGETDGIGTAAIDLLTAKIVDNQTLNVDSVSGATVTSAAFTTAVKAALSDAGVNTAALNGAVAYADAKSEPIVMNADVIVIGAGGAGFAAATTAIEEGASVIMIDKAEYIGGNTVRAGGTLNAVDPERQSAVGVEDSVDNFYQNIMDAGDQKSNPELARVLAENSMSARQWLEDHGTEWSEKVYMTIGGLYTRSMDVKDKNSYQGLIEPLLNVITEKGGEIVLNCEAESLILNDAGMVTGVHAKDTVNGQIYRFEAAKGVIIATGGYGSSAELVKKYNNLADLPTSNAPTATGDGIIMGLEAGAELEGMEYIQIHPHGNPVTGMLQSHFAGDVVNAIYVNKNGERFVNEQGRRDEISNATIEQPGQIMFSVFDSECDVYPGVPEYDGMDEMIKKGYVYKADTLEELAELAGIDAAGLTAAAAAYNQLVQQGEDTQYHKDVVEKEIGKGPFYAVPLSPTIHHTMGGLKIDTDARVLNGGGDPIKGLYAAGEVTGGIHGSNRIGGNAIADCFVFGRIAGASAVNEK